MDGRRGWLLAWLAMAPWAVLRAGSLSDSDTFWEIRTGMLIVDRGAIPTTDPFSWTAHGAPWTLNSWGFDVVLGAVYRLAALAGVALFCAAVMMGVGALVLVLARGLGASALVSGLLLVLAIPFLTAYLTARPQLVDYVAVLLLVLLLRRLADDRPRPAWALAGIVALTVVWVNLHAGALFGVAVVGLCALLLLLRRDTRGRGWWCLAAAAAAGAAALANPQGLGIVAQTAAVKSASAGIVEWQHLDPAHPLEVAKLLVGLLALVLAYRRRDAAFTAVLAVSVAGGVTAVRLLPMLVLVSLPVLASTPVVLAYGRSRRRMLLAGGVVLTAAFSVLAALSLGHIGRPNPVTYPVRTVAAVPRGCHVYNDYVLGGYLILMRPDVLVSLDSRNDLYGLRRLDAAQQTLAGQGDVDRQLAGAGCVLVPPSTGLAHRLRGEPAWVLTSSAPGAVLFVRTPTAASP
jgi:hypothetical protein